MSLFPTERERTEDTVLIRLWRHSQKRALLVYLYDIKQRLLTYPGLLTLHVANFGQGMAPLCNGSWGKDGRVLLSTLVSEVVS